VVQPAQETKKEEKNLFDADEELRKQAEAEKEARRLKEEEERQRKEEEKRLEKQRKEEEKRRKEEERRKKKGPSLWDKLGNFSKDIFSDDGLN
jgi:cell division protein FtsA